MGELSSFLFSLLSAPGLHTGDGRPGKGVVRKGAGKPEELSVSELKKEAVIHFLWGKQGRNREVIIAWYHEQC